MNDFSNVLWAYEATTSTTEPDVGRFGSDDPGEPLLDRPESIEGAEMYRKLVSIAHPPARAGTGPELAEAFMAARSRWARSGTSSRRASSRRGSPARSATRGSRAGRSAARTCTAARGSASTASRRSASREPRGCSSTGRRRRRRSCRTSKSEVGGGTPTREIHLQAARGGGGAQAAVEMPNVLTTDAVFEAWQPDGIGLRPKIAAWNECDTVIFTELSKMLAGGSRPRSACETPRTASKARSSAPRP